MLAARFGPTTGPWLGRLARGQGSTRVDGEPYVPRGRSREVTFQENLTDAEEVRRQVVLLADRVAADVAADARPAVRVVVKVRYAPFLTRTHGSRVDPPSAAAADIERAALAALDLFTEDRPVRLLGLRAELTPPAAPAERGRVARTGGATTPR